MLPVQTAIVTQKQPAGGSTTRIHPGKTIVPNSPVRGSTAHKRTQTVDQGHDYDETSPVVENYTFDVLESNPRRNEAYATLQIKLDNLPGTHSFKLKTDTGAQANTMPFRTYGQMFPNNVDECGNPNSKFMQPTNSTLTAYNGSEITCRGTIDIDCAYNGQQWASTQFFVVDVPGPAILGLVTLSRFTVHSTETQCRNMNQSKTLLI